MFKIESTESFNADRLVNGNEYDYITRTSVNQGIMKTTGFINSENINPSGIWSLGLLQMTFFYREKSWYAGQFVRKIIPKISIPKNAVLYFTTVLNMCKSKLLSVLVRNVDETFKETSVKLPIKSNGKIDFDFMEHFIAELKEERLAELRAYLKVCGLDNYELTNEEKEVIFNYKFFQWDLYNIENLFGKSTRGKRLKSEDRIEGTLPFVTAGENCEGISAYIGNNVKIFFENTITVDMFGSAKYRNYQYGADDHIAVVHSEKISMKSAIFVTSAIHKVAHNGKFNYGNNFYAKDADGLDIMLPTKNGKPDYELMDTLISAVQKLVIKDVVLYADREIEATEKIINNN